MVASTEFANFLRDQLTPLGYITMRRMLYLAEYERLAGAHLQQLEWFEALACSLRLRDVVIALSNGPEKLGWRPDIASTVRAQIAGNRETYEFLRELTGVRVPEVETLLV